MGDRVAVRVGGSFTYRPGDEARPLLLVGGGIGVNPLLSILRHCCELRGFRGVAGAEGEPANAPAPAGAAPAGEAAAAVPETAAVAAAAAAPPVRFALLYSAAAPAELAFQRDLRQLQRWAGGGLRLHLHVTGPEWRGREAEWGGRWGRIARPDLQAALRWLERQHGGAPAGSSGSSGGRAGAGNEVAALLCGPPAMEDAVLCDLRSLGLQPGQIRFERWW